MNDAAPGHWDPSVLSRGCTGRSAELLSAGLMVKYLRGNVICDQRRASTPLHYGDPGGNR